MEYGKRKPVLQRKPGVVIAIGMSKPPLPERVQGKMAAMSDTNAPREDTASEESDGLVCPKCGAELADTPENRKYAEMREAEMDESEDERESDDDEMDED